MSGNHPDDEAAVARLNELLAMARQEDCDLNAIVKEAMPLMAGRIGTGPGNSIETDFYGCDALDYYLKEPLDKISYGYVAKYWCPGRETPGAIKHMHADGSLSQVDHPLAGREIYFVSCPLAKIQELAQSDSETVVVELPELTKVILAGGEGTIVLVCDRKEMQRLMRGARGATAAVLDLAVNPARRQALVEKMKTVYPD